MKNGLECQIVPDGKRSSAHTDRNRTPAAAISSFSSHSGLFKCSAEGGPRTHAHAIAPLLPPRQQSMAKNRCGDDDEIESERSSIFTRRLSQPTTATATGKLLRCRAMHGRGRGAVCEKEAAPFTQPNLLRIVNNLLEGTSPPAAAAVLTFPWRRHR